MLSHPNNVTQIWLIYASALAQASEDIFIVALNTSPELLDDAMEDKKRRTILSPGAGGRRAPGWTPLQGKSNFSFERAARTMTRGGPIEPEREVSTVRV